MGIIIPAATSLESPEAKNQVEWEKESTKDKTGFAYSGKNSFKSGEGEFTVIGQGDSFKESHAYGLFVDVPGASANSGATIAAKNAEGKEAFIDAETTASTEEVSVGAGSELKTLLDASGKSNFLQLSSGAKRKINFGSVEVEWPGTNRSSNVKTITHGLGATPKAVLMTANGFAGVYGEVNNAGATTFELRGTVSEGIPPGGVKQTIFWTAIG